MYVDDKLQIFKTLTWGTGIRGLMRGMATLPQCNQELLVVRDKVGRPPGEIGVSKSFSFILCVVYFVIKFIKYND